MCLNLYVNTRDDDQVIGAGIGGLTCAALVAQVCPCSYARCINIKTWGGRFNVVRSARSFIAAADDGHVNCSPVCLSHAWFHGNPHEWRCTNLGSNSVCIKTGNGSIYLSLCKSDSVRGMKDSAALGEDHDVVSGNLYLL